MSRIGPRPRRTAGQEPGEPQRLPQRWAIIAMVTAAAAIIGYLVGGAARGDRRWRHRARRRPPGSGLSRDVEPVRAASTRLRWLGATHSGPMATIRSAS